MLKINNIFWGAKVLNLITNLIAIPQIILKIQTINLIKIILIIIIPLIIIKELEI